MALDRDELAARATAARAALLALCDALSALVPVAPASGAPATDPRRTVGAVTHPKHDSALWIIINGDETDCCRRLDGPNSGRLGDFFRDDVFVRWATREECERHSIPYVARPLPGAPLAAPSRPEWVRITSLNAGAAGFLTVGKVYRVTGFGHRGCPQVNNDQGDGMWFLSSRGLSPDPESPTFASWEPCAAPSPAATPAAWVPSVGDVVKQMTETDAVATTGAIRVVVSTTPLRWVYVANGAKVGEVCEPGGWEGAVRFVRRATSSERAAAGLDAPKVDREGLARAIYEAVRAGNMLMGAKKWNELGDLTKRDSFNAADAAIAFMAKGPAFDRADFNEAKDREAAMEAYRAGTDGCIDPDGTKYPTCRDSFRNGWLARARVAAKGGA